MTLDQRLSTVDEIRIGLSYIRYGLLHIKNLHGRPTELDMSLLLLSNGYERLLKILICLDYYNCDGQYPNEDTFYKQKLHTHKLKSLLSKVIVIAQRYPLYGQAPARIEDISFLSGNVDFMALLELMHNFADTTRYYNLNTIIGKKSTVKKPEEIISLFRTAFLLRHPEWEPIVFSPI